MKTDLEAVLKMLAEATPKPWRWLGDSLVQTAHITRDVWHLPRNEHDKKLIAAAPQLIHDMAQEIEELRGKLCAAVKALNQYKDNTFTMCSDCERYDDGEPARTALEAIKLDNKELAHLGDPCQFCKTPHDQTREGLTKTKGTN